jgi:cytochrome P450
MVRRPMTAPDLSDPALYQDTDPIGLWARLRADTPVFHTDRPAAASFWSVLSHSLAREVVREHETFVSSRGMRLDGDPAAVDGAANKMLIVSDPPRHGEIRRIINSAFTPRVARRLESSMRTVVADTVRRAIDEGECDFVTTAARLPVSVICDLLGVPHEDWDFLLGLTRTAFGSGAPAEMVEAHTEILMYYDYLLELRRQDPQEDVVTALLHGEVNGVRLTDEEIFLNCDGLLSGGNETTRHAIVGGLLAFVEAPDQWRRLAPEPGLMATAVQEVLRFTSPAMHVLRTASRDTELGGCRIAAGEQVAVWLPAANRDGEVFPAPDAFDIGRSPNRHLTFAQGVHFCLGSALATTELTVMFTELLGLVDHAEATGPARRLRSNLIWGFESLPVALKPR